MISRTFFLLSAAVLGICFSSAQTSYNLPLEITDIALNGKGGDGGTDLSEFKKLNSGNLGVSGGRSFVGDGLTLNSGGIDIRINVGWYPSEFGNEPIYLRLFYLTASPLLYSPEGLHLESRFNTRIVETFSDEGSIYKIKVLRSNGYLIEYELEEGSNIMKPIGKQAGYMSYVVKESETIFRREDGLGNAILYDLENPNDITYQSAFGRTVTSSEAGSEEEILYENYGYENQRIKQVVTAQSGVDINVVDPYSYTIEFYDDSQLGPKDAYGYYTFTGSPMVSWLIENPSRSDENFNRLKITKVMGTAVYEFKYKYTNEKGWNLEQGEDTAARSESHSRKVESSSNTIINDWVLRNYVGDRVREYSEVSSNFSFGEAVTQRGVNTDEGYLWQKMDYYDAASELGSYGKLQSIESPNGSWVEFQYDGEGRLHFQHSTWEDAAIGSGSEASVSEYFYDPIVDYDNFDSATHLPRKIIARVAGKIVSKSFFVYHFSEDHSEYEQIVEQAHIPNAEYGDTLNPRVTTTYYGSISSIPAVARGRQKTIQYADNRLDSFSYEKLGDGHIKTTIQEGTVNNPEGLALRTTKTEIETDKKGNQVKIESFLKTESGWETLTLIEHTYDEHDNLVESRKDGRVVYEAEYENMMLVSATGESGETYTYTYDSLGQISVVTKIGLTEEQAGDYDLQEDIHSISEYDAAGRRVSSEIQAGSLSLKSYYEYDSAGRITKITEPGGFTTEYEYEEGGRVIRKTRPDGSEVVTTKRIDGMVASVQGCCVVDRYFSYNINDDGLYVETTHLKEEDGERWRKSYTDLLGRSRKSEAPAYGGGVNAVEYTYNDKGQLARTRTTGVPDQLYEYDDFGNILRLGSDIDGDGTLEKSSMDRISERSFHFEYDTNEAAWYMVRNGYVYAEDNSAKATALGESHTRITNWVTDPELGTLVSESVSYDLHGNKSRGKIFLDRDNKLVTRTIEAPTLATPVKNVSQNGRLVAKENPMSGRMVTFDYDALGRVVKTYVPDGETNTLTTQTVYYVDSGFVSHRIDNLGKFTSYEYYDNGEVGAGRVKVVTDPKGKTVTYEYTPRGQILRVWGETITPYSVEYNDYGERTKLHLYLDGSDWNSPTWDGATPGTPTTTTYNYDSVTGLMLSVTDPLGHTTSTEYDQYGRAIRKTNARGQYSDYTYDPVTSQIREVAFSDATDGFSYDYDRVGRLVSLEDGVGNYEMQYGDKLQMTRSEISVLGLEKRITAEYEEEAGTTSIPGRPKAMQIVNTADGTADYFAEFSFDSFGRITGVSDLHEKFTYTYESGSNMITRIANADLAGNNVILAANYTYDPDRGSITQVDNQLTTGDPTPVTVSISTYGYQYTEEGLLDTATRSGTEFSQPEFSKYEYNDRFELTGVKDYQGSDTEDQSNPFTDRDFAYVYGSNGNRVQETTGTQPAIDYTYDVFDRLLDKSISGVVQESYQYDDDGNLLQDGVFHYTWNALSQLIQIDPVVIDLGAQRLSFRYDYKGRRVQKIVESFNGSIWTTIKNEKTLYNGWNPVAVYDGLNGNALIRRYTWGLDISNSFGGAGGIGGLLSVEEVDGQSITKYLFAYDGSGNVTQVVDAADGEVVASYYYDAYGNLIGSSGTYADANPFRYQTKLYDEETGLIYYGYRYYNPSNGRFLGKDPLGYGGGFNLYQFVNSSPVNGFEYLGAAAYSAYSMNPTKPQPTTAAPGGNYEWKCTQQTGINPGIVFKYDDAGNIVGSYHDPSKDTKVEGYRWRCDWEKKPSGGFMGFLKKIVAPVVTAIVTAIVPGGPIIAAAIGGFAGGAAGALANGGSLGDALQAGLVGGAIGAITAGIMTTSNPISDAVSKVSNTIKNGINAVTGNTLSNAAANTATSMVLGGGVSELTGGNFTDGALSALASAVGTGIGTNIKESLVSESSAAYGPGSSGSNGNVKVVEVEQTKYEATILKEVGTSDSVVERGMEILDDITDNYTQYDSGRAVKFFLDQSDSVLVLNGHGYSAYQGNQISWDPSQQTIYHGAIVDGYTNIAHEAGHHIQEHYALGKYATDYYLPGGPDLDMVKGAGLNEGPAVALGNDMRAARGYENLLFDYKGVPVPTRVATQTIDQKTLCVVYGICE